MGLSAASEGDVSVRFSDGFGADWRLSGFDGSADGSAIGFVGLIGDFAGFAAVDEVFVTFSGVSLVVGESSSASSTSSTNCSLLLARADGASSSEKYISIKLHKT